MSETHFSNEPPKKGGRVEVVHGAPPRPYVVRSWINEQLVDEKAFGTKAEADQYQAARHKQRSNASRPEG